MQTRFVTRLTAGAVILAAFAAAIAAWPGRAAAAPYGDTIRACDNENQKKAGSCQKTERSMGVLHGCAGSVCFVCPTDGRRQCYPATDSSAGGVLHANIDVALPAGGVNVEAVVKACDYIHQHGKPCNYSVDSLSVVEGRSSSTAFQCVDKKECHRAN